ncbi:IS3 family transposase, partial [Serratia fonticola]
ADDSALRLRIREITETRIHYGYRRVHVMLRREGWRDNHKRIYRLYCEQGLSLRLKRPRCNKSAQRRQPQPQGLYPNHVWGMDFVSDALFDCVFRSVRSRIGMELRSRIGTEVRSG